MLSFHVSIRFIPVSGSKSSSTAIVGVESKAMSFQNGTLCHVCDDGASLSTPPSSFLYEFSIEN